ncbi:hypothetical protein M0811_07651 [Anaeramoeba ignava]|uniref:Uncharacterized protein n=1 Tax=Anaeramoeba ignava TaxID=1746090 RepID=A0A9Q0LLC1_ANAIG|nr:hypothetical protein M0811_07651 [Anaeramoeba ignava]
MISLLMIMVENNKITSLKTEKEYRKIYKAAKRKIRSINFGTPTKFQETYIWIIQFNSSKLREKWIEIFTFPSSLWNSLGFQERRMKICSENMKQNQKASSNRKDT